MVGLADLTGIHETVQTEIRNRKPNFLIFILFMSRRFFLLSYTFPTKRRQVKLLVLLMDAHSGRILFYILHLRTSFMFDGHIILRYILVLCFTFG